MDSNISNPKISKIPTTIVDSVEEEEWLIRLLEAVLASPLTASLIRFTNQLKVRLYNSLAMALRLSVACIGPCLFQLYIETLKRKKSNNL